MKLTQILTETETEEHLNYAGIDPTTQSELLKFKPHYQQWGIREIRKGENPHSVLDALNYYNRHIRDNRYQQILSKITPAPKNILSLSLDQVKTSQQNYDIQFNKTSNREVKRQLKQNYATTLANEPGLKIVKVEKWDGTDGAAKVLSNLARGTKWCVTDTETGNEYLDQGPLYVIIINGKRLLCHIETDQLMNEMDEPVRLCLSDYNKLSRFIPNVGLFYEDKNSKIYIDAAKNNPKLAYYHAYDVIKGRWSEAEPIIMKDPEWAYYYALMVIGGRWPEAEPIIMKDPKSAYEYAKNVIGGRWLEAEPTIMKDPAWAYYYSKL